MLRGNEGEFDVVMSGIFPPMKLLGLKKTPKHELAAESGRNDHLLGSSESAQRRNVKMIIMGMRD